jgi:hypothetical protein
MQVVHVPSGSMTITEINTVLTIRSRMVIGAVARLGSGSTVGLYNVWVGVINSLPYWSVLLDAPNREDSSAFITLSGNDDIYRCDASTAAAPGLLFGNV